MGGYAARLARSRGTKGVTYDLVFHHEVRNAHEGRTHKLHAIGVQREPRRTACRTNVRPRAATHITCSCPPLKLARLHSSSTIAGLLTVEHRHGVPHPAGAEITVVAAVQVSLIRAEGAAPLARRTRRSLPPGSALSSIVLALRAIGCAQGDLFLLF